MNTIKYTIGNIQCGDDIITMLVNNGGNNSKLLGGLSEEHLYYIEPETNDIKSTPIDSDLAIILKKCGEYLPTPVIKIPCVRLYDKWYVDENYGAEVIEKDAHFIVMGGLSFYCRYKEMKQWLNDATRVSGQELLRLPNRKQASLIAKHLDEINDVLVSYGGFPVHGSLVTSELYNDDMSTDKLIWQHHLEDNVACCVDISHQWQFRPIIDLNETPEI